MNSAAKFARIDHDMEMPLRGRAAQLGEQFMSEVIGRNHGWTLR
jgi:hypothetical protein